MAFKNTPKNATSRRLSVDVVCDVMYCG